MPFTASDAQKNMQRLIDGLKNQFAQLTSLMNSLTSFSKKAEVNNLRSKVSIEIHHRELLAAFDAASVAVIRPPTQDEIVSLQNTLGDLDRELKSLADFQAIVTFVEDVMTQNAARFTEILETINLNS